MTTFNPGDRVDWEGRMATVVSAEFNAEARKRYTTIPTSAVLILIDRYNYSDIYDCHTPLPYRLILVKGTTLEYDPTQQGDTDDDI